MRKRNIQTDRRGETKRVPFRLHNLNEDKEHVNSNNNYNLINHIYFYL